MKVSELIAILQGCPPDQDVFIRVWPDVGSGYNIIDDVVNVEQMRTLVLLNGDHVTP